MATHEKIDVIFIGGGDVLLWVAQVLRRMGRVRRTVVTLEDWSVPNKDQTFYNRINRLKIRLNDKLLSRMDTKVVIFNKEIERARRAHLGAEAVKNTVVFENQWRWFVRPKTDAFDPQKRKHLLFLGTLRERFGLESLFEIMPELNREYGMRLKIIGPENDIYQHYRSLSTQLGLDDIVDWRGFVPNESLLQETADCFGGVNLQESSINDSSLTFAGRVINYLQFLVVPILSPFSGALTDIVRTENMGVVCDAKPEKIKEAVVKAFVDREAFANQIRKYFADSEKHSGSFW